jgi:hypothetical protein
MGLFFSFLFFPGFFTILNYSLYQKKMMHNAKKKGDESQHESAR